MVIELTSEEAQFIMNLLAAVRIGQISNEGLEIILSLRKKLEIKEFEESNNSNSFVD